MVFDDPDNFISLRRTPQPDREFSTLHPVGLGDTARSLQLSQPRGIARDFPRHLCECEITLEASGLEVIDVPRNRTAYPTCDELVRLRLFSLGASSERLDLLPRHFQLPPVAHEEGRLFLLVERRSDFLVREIALEDRTLQLFRIDRPSGDLVPDLGETILVREFLLEDGLERDDGRRS